MSGFSKFIFRVVALAAMTILVEIDHTLFTDARMEDGAGLRRRFRRFHSINDEFRQHYVYDTENMQLWPRDMPTTTVRHKLGAIRKTNTDGAIRKNVKCVRLHRQGPSHQKVEEQF